MIGTTRKLCSGSLSIVMQIVGFVWSVGTAGSGIANALAASVCPGTRCAVVPVVEVQLPKAATSLGRTYRRRTAGRGACARRIGARRSLADTRPCIRRVPSIEAICRFRKPRAGQGLAGSGYARNGDLAISGPPRVWSRRSLEALGDVSLQRGTLATVRVCA
jgi:hypothetical protein